jgi:leucine dehydrogenase
MSAVAGELTNGHRVEEAPAEKVPAHTETVPPVEFDHEELVIRRGPRSGMETIVAVHSTTLGPALGGVRLWRYDSVLDGSRDGLRLARGMTYKAAAAGLDLGGGKGVIVAPEGPDLDGPRRRDALLDFGDLVESLEGRYITAEDVGISPEDLVAIRERTSQVTGLPPEHGGSGDPSPFTAIGVEAAIRACLAEAFGSAELHGRRIAIAGVGHVGAKLATRLAEHGAELILSDIDPGKRMLAERLGADWVEPEAELVVDCDVLAPCALGGAIHEGNVEELRCSIVCGSANNVLADDALAERLAAREILYAPDFIANAGGLIHVYGEIHGLSDEETVSLAEGIRDSTSWVLEAARLHGITPLAAAYEVARERLEAARRRYAPAKLAS